MRASLRLLLLATLAACAAVALFDEPAETAPAAATPRPAARGPSSVQQNAPRPWPAGPRGEELAWAAPGPGARQAWAPPPPPPPPPVPKLAAAPQPPPAPPPAPRAPPFPYELIGRVEAEGNSQALLAGPLRTLAVKAGDTVDGQWRVDSVTASGVSLVWIDGGQRRNLNFRSRVGA